MRLEHHTVILRRREPFVSRKGSVLEVRQVMVRLVWQGRVGLGAAVLGREHGMTEATICDALDACAVVVRGSTPFHLEALLDACEAAAVGQPTVVAAVDMAIHDLLGQAAGLPLHRMWGLEGRPSPPTAITLGVMDAAARVRRARALSGWPILKLKLDSHDDLGVVASIRRVYGGRLWIDANGSWDADRAIAAAVELAGYGVELLEQPVPPGRLDALGTVHRHSPIPVVADEDCMGPADVLRLSGCVDAINIKLVKCGGLRRAREMIRLARLMGLRVMVGCKTEGVLGITAMAHLTGLVDHVDLDGHLDLVDDPHIGIAVDHGRITLPRGPGLGVVASSSRLQEPQ